MGMLYHELCSFFYFNFNLVWCTCHRRVRTAATPRAAASLVGFGRSGAGRSIAKTARRVARHGFQPQAKVHAQFAEQAAVKALLVLEAYGGTPCVVAGFLQLALDIDSIHHLQHSHKLTQRGRNTEEHEVKYISRTITMVRAKRRRRFTFKHSMSLFVVVDELAYTRGKCETITQPLPRVEV
jgi:HEPN domain-containing protein